VTLVPFALVVPMAPPAGASAGPALAWLLFVGSSVHVASTWWLYTLPEVRTCATQSRVRYVVVPALLIVVAAVAAAVTNAGTFAWMLVPFLAWQLFHFQRQNLGMVALTARATGAEPLDTIERRLISLSAIAGIAALLSRPERLQLDVDPHISWLFPFATIVYAIVVGIGLACVSSRRRGESGTTRLLLAVTYLFFVPVFVFSSPYAAVAGLTIAHGLQYLVLLGFIGVARQRTRAYAVAALLTIALLGGALLHDASHKHGASSGIERALFGAFLGVTMAHFVVDAGWWRLRDPAARRFVQAYVPELVGPTATA
jgi:hypothetical protein